MISRIQFLRGHFHKGARAIRPPWSIAEAQFVERCSRCDHCIAACPARILERGVGGFPQINLNRGECTFCGDCVTACKEPLFIPDQKNSAPWNLTATIEESCITHKGVVCQTCGEICAQRAIGFKPVMSGLSRPELDHQLCNGCGACVAPCPSNSIKMT